MKKLTAYCLFVLLFSAKAFPNANPNNVNLPDIGTAAVATLSIGQEIEMGDYYTRLLQGSSPILSDPVLNQYINKLGSQLVNHSDSVQTPFHFYIMKSDVLNAFAYFGGNIVVHSKLIMTTDNESELASVMSHEIGHVTQRHLARAMEKQSKSSPYFWGAALGSILLGLANPEAGIAAISSTIAGSEQSKITFSQSNEQEADRTGLRTLVKSGFDPYASSDFLQKLADQSRFSSKMPEMLMTHPLPDNRLTDIRNRTIQYTKKNVESSLDYYLAKARLVALIGDNKNAVKQLLKEYGKINTEKTKIAISYISALVEYRDKKFSNAKNRLQPLLDADPNNFWFIDLMTDINLSSNQKSVAISRLLSALKKEPDNCALQLNLINSYIENGNLQKAISLLHRYTQQYPNDINGWDLSFQAYRKSRMVAQQMSAKAELLALQGEFQQAITLLKNGKKEAKNQTLVIARMDARINELEQLQKRYAKYRH